MATNHRKSLRIRFDQMVQVYPVLIDSARKFQPAAESDVLKIKNISKDGVCLETHGFLIPHQIYRIDFHFFANYRIQAFVKVIWSERTSGGFEFLTPQYLVELLFKSCVN